MSLSEKMTALCRTLGIARDVPVRLALDMMEKNMDGRGGRRGPLSVCVWVAGPRACVVRGRRHTAGGPCNRPLSWLAELGKDHFLSSGPGH